MFTPEASFVQQARVLAANTVDGAVNPYASQTENLQALRTAYAETIKSLSPRERHYFRKEFSNQLATNRKIHFLDVMNRSPDAYDYGLRQSKKMKRDLITLEDVERRVPRRLPETAGRQFSDDEKMLMQRLMNGMHLSEACRDPSKLTDNVVACAAEMYPLNTLRYLRAVAPEKITPEFAYRMAVHAVCGVNAADAEQFDVRVLQKELRDFPESVQRYFQTGLYYSQKANRMDIHTVQDRLARRQLATSDMENRRLRNIEVAKNENYEQFLPGRTPSVDPKTAHAHSVQARIHNAMSPDGQKKSAGSSMEEMIARNLGGNFYGNGQNAQKEEVLDLRPDDLFASSRRSDAATQAPLHVESSTNKAASLPEEDMSSSFTAHPGLESRTASALAGEKIDGLNSRLPDYTQPFDQFLDQFNRSEPKSDLSGLNMSEQGKMCPVSPSKIKLTGEQKEFYRKKIARECMHSQLVQYDKETKNATYEWGGTGKLHTDCAGQQQNGLLSLETAFPGMLAPNVAKAIKSGKLYSKDLGKQLESQYTLKGKEDCSLRSLLKNSENTGYESFMMDYTTMQYDENGNHLRHVLRLEKIPGENDFYVHDMNSKTNGNRIRRFSEISYFRNFPNVYNNDVRISPLEPSISDEFIQRYAEADIKKKQMQTVAAADAAKMQKDGQCPRNGSIYGQAMAEREQSNQSDLLNFDNLVALNQ